jgi:hypothetical protein
MINPFKKFTNPAKYSQKIDINKIVAAPKLHKKGVEKYKEIIQSGKSVRPLIVLKHPHQDLYAVLDGHHRFYAFLELGNTTVDAVVVRSNKALFGLTKKGYLQPTPRMTKYIHIPLLVFTKYVNNFVRHPVRLIKSTKSVVTKIKRKKETQIEGAVQEKQVSNMTI